jgi:hypothetical protein
MTTSEPAPTAPATSNTCGDPGLDQAIQEFVTAFCRLEPSGFKLEEGAADALISLWLERGRDLRQLWKRLKQQKMSDEWAAAWARDIDYLFAGRTGRGVDRDRLRQEVAQLVRQLNEKANDPGIYRELVALGYQNELDLGWFKSCLEEEEMEKSRISEIIRIVKSKATAEQFIAGALSVRRALFLARLTPDEAHQARKNKAPADGKAGAAVEETTPPDKKTESPLDKRLTSTIQALLILVQEELARNVRGQKPKEWRKRVGLYQLSFQPMSPARNGRLKPRQITVS